MKFGYNAHLRRNQDVLHHPRHGVLGKIVFVHSMSLSGTGASVRSNKQKASCKICLSPFCIVESVRREVKEVGYDSEQVL